MFVVVLNVGHLFGRNAKSGSLLEHVACKVKKCEVICL